MPCVSWYGKCVSWYGKKRVVVREKMEPKACRGTEENALKNLPVDNYHITIGVVYGITPLTHRG